jgi:hypothetical protein
VTLPSQLLRTMAATLSDKLGTAVSEVRPHSGSIKADTAKDTISFKPPAVVLVTCLGFELRGDGYAVADAVWAAIVLANAIGSDGDGKILANMYAANVAAQVSAIVEVEAWEKQAFKRAERIRVTNEHSEKMTKGSSWGAWVVAWTQPFEITREDAAEIHRLASIHHTFVMGDSATPDAYATLEFPEPTV